MRHITSVTLKNFQSYKNHTIHFTDGLNLILGSSDSGKSAIMRAISFVLYNYPRSNTLIHNGEEQAEVTVTFSDGLKVTRIKGKRNAYIANLPDGKSIELDKVDKTVPEEIKKLLHNPPEDDFNGLISYADQFSKMFLVDLSPTDLPRSLSNLTGVESLEEVAKNLMQSYKSIEKQLKLDEKEYEKVNNEYHAYDDLYNVEKVLKSAKLKVDKINEMQLQIDNLKEFECDLIDEDLEDQLTKIEDCVCFIDLIKAKSSDIDKKCSLLDSLNLFNLMIENKYTEEDLNNIDDLITGINLQKEKLKEITNKVSEFETYNLIQKEYETIKMNGKEASQQYTNQQNEYQKLSDDYKDFIDDLTAKNIICDKCGSVLK